MIPINFIHQWREQAPWTYQSQIEQDLVLSRALVSLYQQPVIQKALAFRGGTALNKLFYESSTRYSEDLDFVQIQAGPSGRIIDAIRQAIDPWLGQARWKQDSRSVKLLYRFQSEDEPSIPLRLKIEINTTEPFSVFGFEQKPYSVNSRWFSSQAIIRTYTLDELMATKFRALYQRLKGRDLYDLWMAVTQLQVNVDQLIQAFHKYNAFHQVSISRAEYERNLTLKMQDQDFLLDAKHVLSTDTKWDPAVAFELIAQRLITQLPGDPWRGTGGENKNTRQTKG